MGRASRGFAGEEIEEKEKRRGRGKSGRPGMGTLPSITTFALCDHTEESRRTLAGRLEILEKITFLPFHRLVFHSIPSIPGVSQEGSSARDLLQSVEMAGSAVSSGLHPSKLTYSDLS